jgi:sugar lactone lactonase YvrE
MIVAACATTTDVGEPLKVLAEATVPGFAWPESVGCDTRHDMLFVSQFGGEKPNPTAKDGLGFISSAGPDGKILEKKYFDVTMNKPKGIWIVGSRLWVTDIDSLWIFDTASRRSRKVEIPGIQFANDVIVMNGAAYVSDNRIDRLYRIAPADYLETSVTPKIEMLWEKKGVFPNGLWPAKDGRLLMAGYEGVDKPKALFAMKADGTIEAISKPIGRLDGLAERDDGTILATDWDSGSVFRYGPKGEVQELAKGFKGPADLCTMGKMLYVPDLVKGEIRILKLDR